MSTEIDILLPENDPDLALARRIGSFLEHPAGAASATDPLEKILFQWKARHTDQTALFHIDSDALWQRIDSALPHPVSAEPLKTPAYSEPVTTASTPAAAPVFRLNWGIWAAAAAVLFVAFFGYSLYFVPEHYGPFPQNQLVELSDGSRITLRKNSSLSVLEGVFSSDVRVELFGEAKFEVTKNRKRSFLVKAGESLVEVTGTVFYVAKEDSKTRVFLEEGSITFSSPVGAPVFLKPGQSAAASLASAPEVIEKPKPAEISDWIQNKVIFENAAVRDVLPDLERHYGIRFDLDPDLLNEQLSGELLLESEKQVLEDLGQALGGRFELHGTVYRFTRD